MASSMLLRNTSFIGMNGMRTKGNNKVDKGRVVQPAADEFMTSYKHSAKPNGAMPAVLSIIGLTRDGSQMICDASTGGKPFAGLWSTIATLFRDLLGKPRNFDNIYNMKQFLSGRTFLVGGIEATAAFP